MEKRLVFKCLVCDREFHRWPSEAARGKTKTCSIVCRNVLHQGEGNPFAGRAHSEESKGRISESRKGKGKGRTHNVGRRHTEEARKKIAEASKRLWLEKRDQMIASLPRGKDHHYYLPPGTHKYRQNFHPAHRRLWKAAFCAYCGTTERLEVDHIVPVFDGGTSIKANAQTLCRGCNLWKFHFVDLVRFHAAREAATRTP